jgi:hypothetical protein
MFINNATGQFACTCLDHRSTAMARHISSVGSPSLAQFCFVYFQYSSEQAIDVYAWTQRLTLLLDQVCNKRNVGSSDCGIFAFSNSNLRLA